MDNNKIQLIGSPCGHHGPYTFYKAFKYHKNGKHKILSLSDFFFVKLWSDSDLMSIGELILLWVDKNSEQVLASLRLYFLPENTPEGRNDDHGEDEVLAISEKVVLRADDLLGWITDEVRWPRGLPAVWERECPGPALAEAPHLVSSLLVDSALDLQDVQKEKSLLGEPDPEESGVVVLSFARYCRFRGIMKRLEGVSNKWLHNALVLALGGFAAPCRNTRVLFCKDTFDYPDLEGHEQLCNHLAPNLKGRPRKRPKKRSLSPGGSESNESESSLSTVSSSLRSKQQIPGRNGLRCNSIAQQNSPARGKKVEREVGPDEKEFLVKLHSFMKSRRTPISRVPHLGFKEIDLYAFFTKVQKLGGYNSVTANRLWKTIYDELGGHQGSTSAATYTRRHYERLLLPYEKSTRGEQKDGVRNHTKLKAVKSEDKSDEEKDDVDSPIETSSEKGAENESSKEKNSSGESKTAALRSIRPKMEKVEENVPSDKENIPVSNSLTQVNTSSSIANASVSGNSNSGLVNGSLTKTSSTTNCMTNGEASSTPTTEVSAENDDPKVVPEVIDLASDESQVKIGKTPVPAFKKRKLEILKEGGLEVTAISSLGSETSVTPVIEKRPSVIQHAAPVTAPPSDNNQVSITVTPDVGHILGSPRGEVASTPSPISPFDTSTNHSNVINVQDLKHKMHNQNLPQDAPPGSWSRRFPPKVVQSRSIYTHSESTVYGNPKDIFDPRQLLYSERVPGRMVPHTEEEVLDLRVKSPQKSTLSVNRVHPIAAASVDSPRNLSKTVNKTNNSAFPLLAGRAIVGSNLEITVVDVPKASTNQVKVNPPLPQKPHQPPSRKTNKSSSHRLPPRNENGKFMSMNSQSQSATLHRSTSNSSGGTSLIIPNPYLSSACGRSTPSARTRVSQSQSTVPTSSPSGMIPSFLPGSTSLFPGFLPPVSAANNGGKNSNPFLALSDPLYYSSLYTSHGLYPPSLTPGFVSPLVTPPLFPPSAEQIQLYKELMSQHHTNVRLAQGAANFLGLPRDGSTSITPVGPSTNPSSK